MRRMILLAVVLVALAAAGCQQEGTCTDGSVGCDDGDRKGGLNNGRNNGANNGTNNGDPLPPLTDAGARAVAGTWELTYTVQARNDVMRLVPVAVVTWELEIFYVERNEFSGKYDWVGAVRGGELCMQSQDEFEAGEDSCSPVGRLSMGKCSGHTCRTYAEVGATGRFDPETETMQIDRMDGDAYFADDERGYINIEAGLDNDAQPIDGSSPAECDKWCAVNLRPRSLLSDTYPNIEGDDRQTTLVKLSENRRVTDAVSDFEESVVVGDQEAAIADMSGMWLVDVGLHVNEKRYRASYDLDIFQVEPLTEVGVYRWSGELTAESFCPPRSDGAMCAAHMASLGRCVSDSCIDEGRVAATGRYDALRGTFELDQTEANVFHEGEGDSRLWIELTLRVQSTTSIAAEEVRPTRCEQWCTWFLHPDGAFESDFEYTQGDYNTFSMIKLDD